MQHRSRHVPNAHARQRHHVLHERRKHGLQKLARRDDDTRFRYARLHLALALRREGEDAVFCLAL